MSTLAGYAARLSAAGVIVFCVKSMAISGAARAETCVSASWYHEGARTATGERYRPDGLTAAHRTLRLGTRLQVFNKRNGRSVMVRVNDRGPARWTRRSLDLSRGAARQLGMIHSGVGSVCYRVIDKERQAAAAEPAPAVLRAAKSATAKAHLSPPRLTQTAQSDDAPPSPDEDND